MPAVARDTVSLSVEDIVGDGSGVLVSGSYASHIGIDGAVGTNSMSESESRSP